ncbi:hypothetical protein [Nitratireductor sp. XY-223]|uniref:hypothetical protein n=1 Tax=Nitratireductor sp. XY-223 TaxID=2561926 RepID=UPI0010AAACFC|nr:hypothetical protein [Nitratireductor sp. XY-223]
MKVLTSASAALATILLGTAATGHAQAQQLTNNMTCAQAKAMYEAQGRVQTRTRTGTVLPIYGGVPEAKGRFLRCGRTNTARPVSVITSDSNSCTIAYKC